MLDCKLFFDALTDAGVRFYAGVPDSLLKDFCAYVTDNAPSSSHVITANEGGALALAAGHHLATGQVPVVYMQNSGFGNTVNPVTSLADAEVYAIPMLLVVGWRGEPGKKDEPQHVKMGRVQLQLIEALGLEHAVVDEEIEAARLTVQRAIARAKETSAPFVLLVRAGTFDKYKLKATRPTSYAMTREEAIATVAGALPGSFFVCTTGMPSRELFEFRSKNELDRTTDFLTVGSMGHASQIALGVALEKPEKQVVCIDGDGAALMHLGGLSTIGSLGPKNYKHVIVNNGAHDSVGGQPTVGFDVDFGAIARACGYKSTAIATTKDELDAALVTLAKAEGPALLEVRVKTGARSDLGRPTVTPRAAKEAFMERLGRG